MPQENPISILFENNHYIVFNKPAGLLVIPTPKAEKRTLMTLVNESYSKDESWRLHPCHRLDRETSGVIIFAKGKGNQQRLMQAFKERLIKKRYIAFVHGKFAKNKGEMRSHITHRLEGMSHKHSAAKLAITKYKVLEVRKLYSIVEVEPVTGRTNQIRIHFQQSGYPLVGERKYAFARDYSLKFNRVALHAASVEWRDNIDGQYIRVEASLPKDMQEFMQKN